MATLREWLNEAGFDWECGEIVYHETEQHDAPGSHLAPVVGRRRIDSSDEILDQEFNEGFGSPECPRIFAKDDKAIYFPVQYDGATHLERVVPEWTFYLTPGSRTPYPGGG